MTRAPGLVLVCGILSAAMGLLLLAVADRVEGLDWFGAPVAVLGFVLIAVWVRDARRPPPPPDTPESVAANLPGRWYPVTIVGIAAALMVWFMVWAKAR